LADPGPSKGGLGSTGAGLTVGGIFPTMSVAFLHSVIFVLEGVNVNSPFPSETFWWCWAHYGLFFLIGPFFRIFQGLNCPLSKSCEILIIPGLLDGFMRVPVYKKDKSLAFQLRLPSSTLQRSVWSPELRSLIRFSSSSELLANFVLHPESHFDRLGEAPGIRSLQSGPWSRPAIVSGPNEPFTRLLVSAHIHECSSLQPERPQVWQFSFRSPMKHPSQFFKDVILVIFCQLCPLKKTKLRGL
jgi:hypothetical protein